MNTRILAQRRDVLQTVLAIAAVAALLLSLAFSVRPGLVAAFTAGDNGNPTGGQVSDLMGIDATFTFQNNATMECRQNSVTQVSFTIDYDIDGTFPAGANLVVYLSPNEGAINGNAGGDEAGYIATVESNYTTVDLSGLSGSGTLTGSVSVTSAFVADTGGILGVIADEATGAVSTSKTNSLNCTEATGTPAPTPTDTPAPTPTDTPAPTPTSTPEGDTASLNIKKVDAATNARLDGAVFTIDGIPGTFVTGSGTWDVNGNHIPDGTNQAETKSGFVCIIGLPSDSVWTITEITPPAGYELADPASQTHDVDDDGDCASPDVTFENAQSVQPTSTPEGGVHGATGTPAPTSTPEGGVKAATGTPGASQPDTATASVVGNGSVPTMLFVLILLLSLSGLAYLNVGSARKRS